MIFWDFSVDLFLYCYLFGVVLGVCGLSLNICLGQLSLDKELCPYRRDNETFEEYRRRRKAGNVATRRYLKGLLSWDSRMGTFSHKRIEEAIKYNENL